MRSSDLTEAAIRLIKQHLEPLIVLHSAGSPEEQRVYELNTNVVSYLSNSENTQVQPKEKQGFPSKEIVLYIGKQWPTRIEKVCLLLYLASMLCAGLVLIMFLWEHGDYNSPEYMLETDYLHWITPLPALTVCEIPDAAALVSRFSFKDAENEHLVAFLQGLLRPSGRYCEGCEAATECSACQKLVENIDQVSSSCKHAFKSCIWNGRKIDCCANFRPLLTRHGKCFSLNSLQTDGSELSKEFVVSRSLPKAELSLAFNAPVQVFVHDAADVGFLKNDTVNVVRSGQRGHLIYSMREVRVHSSARQLTREQRRCILADELSLRRHRAYSVSACQAECRARAQRRLCNCSHHLSPHTVNDPVCNYEGLQCLDRHFRNPDGTSRKRVRCRCLPPCSTTDLKIVRAVSEPIEAGEIEMIVELLSPPTERLTLHARVSTLDVVVGLACFSRFFTSMNLCSTAHNTFKVAARLHRLWTRRHMAALPYGSPPWELQIFWMITFLLAMFAAAYYISYLYQKWENNPVIVSLAAKATSLREIPFPAITVCNMNRAKKSIALKMTNFDNESYLEERTSYLEYRLLRDLCNLENGINTEEDNRTSKWDTVQNFLVKVGQPCHEMLKSCSYGGTSYDCSDLFNPTLTDEGICCSFNKVHREYLFRNPRDLSDLNVTFPVRTVDWTPEEGYPANSVINSIPYRPRGAGTHLGLYLVMDAQVDEYFCSTTGSTGFKLVLHSPVETPKIAEFGILISPGEEVRLAIRPRISNATPELRYIPRIKRQCLFSGEVYLKYYRTYTQRNCALECEANYTLKKCNCVLSYMPKDAETPICGFNDQECASEARRDMERILTNDDEETYSRIKCTCLPGCSEISYHSTLSATRLDTHFHKSKSYMANFTNKTSFQRNGAVLHLFFKESQFTSQLKGELFGFTEFLSSTGGLLGLFLGFSFMSLAELLYFITLRLWCTITRRENIHMDSSNAETRKVANFTSPYPFTQ